MVEVIKKKISTVLFALYSFSILFFNGCSEKQITEVWQKERNNIIDISSKVVPIEMDSIYISSHGAPYIANEYLLITDYNSPAELIHIFDKNTFKYITSRVQKGRGPKEIMRIGDIEVDEDKRDFYVVDYGKLCIFRYNIDSLLVYVNYTPSIEMKQNERVTLNDYKMINDSISVGRVFKIESNGEYKAAMAKVNTNTGEINFMPYQNPKIKKPRIQFAASLEHNLYVECFEHHNLITICDLDGNLKYNIYGDNWSTDVSNRVRFFGKVRFYKDKIVVLYSGKTRLYNNSNGIGVNYPDKFIVFDLNGNYIKTLDLGCQVYTFAYDEENDRYILNLQNNIHQFAYLNLDGLLE